MSVERIDFQRLPFEIKRAADHAWVLIEAVDPPGIAVDVDGAELVVMDRSGAVLCRVPMHRMCEWDDARLKDIMATRLTQIPAHETDQVVAAMNAGRVSVTAPPDEDWVYVTVDGVDFLPAHRRLVVAGWPPED